MVRPSASTVGTMGSTNGAITSAARNPSTTLGRLAISSMVGFTSARARGPMNSLVQMAASSAIGTPKSMENTVALSDPKTRGQSPSLASKSSVPLELCHTCSASG